jgi:deoxyadenosine/deoxycytidine kinase
VLADKHIFARSMHDSHYLSDDEYDLYLSTYDGLTEMMGIQPLAGIIYLKC